MHAIRDAPGDCPHGYEVGMAVATAGVPHGVGVATTRPTVPIGGRRRLGPSRRLVSRVAVERSGERLSDGQTESNSFSLHGALKMHHFGSTSSVPTMDNHDVSAPPQPRWRWPKQRPMASKRSYRTFLATTTSDARAWPAANCEVSLDSESFIRIPSKKASCYYDPYMDLYGLQPSILFTKKLQKHTKKLRVTTLQVKRFPVKRFPGCELMWQRNWSPNWRSTLSGKHREQTETDVACSCRMTTEQAATPLRPI